MTATGNVVYNNVGVKLTGVNPDGSTEFDQHLDVGDQLTYVAAPRSYGAEEEIELRFEITFDFRQTIRAAARVLGFLGISFQVDKQGQGVTADISHHLQKQKNCFLICLQNGQTSSGPCLICPDGGKFARICC